MNKARKFYVKPEITIIPPDSAKYKEFLQHFERESRGQRFIFPQPPPLSFKKKS